MGDLIKRLRSIEHADVPQKYLMLEAAIEFERLKAENARLRTALDDLVTLKDYRDWHGRTPEYLEKKPSAWQQARDALQDKDND